MRAEPTGVNVLGTPRTAAMPDSRGRATTAPGGLVVLIGAITLLSVHTKVDPDLWGHLRFGLDVLQTRSLSSVDPYSFTQDLPWINHEWASEAILGASYLAGGVAGVVVLKALVVAATLALVWRGLRGYGTAAGSGALVLVAWGAHPLTSTIRPQLWSWLAVVVLITVLRTRLRWMVPLLFVAWSNLHGGWVVGIGLLLASILAAPRSGPSDGALLFTVSALATLVNPYGAGLWRFVAATVRLERAGIGEWQPLWTASPIVWLPWLLAVVLLGAYALRPRASARLLLASAALGCASAMVMRLEPFFVTTVVLWTAPVGITDAPASSDPRLRLIEIGAALALITSVAVAGRFQPACLTADPAWSPDFAVDLGGMKGTIAVPFGWGEYVIWKWGPSLRVSIDGRRETVYSDAVVGPQLALDGDEAGRLAFLDRIRPDFVWYPNADLVAREWLPSHGYHVALVTGRSFVAVRDPSSQMPTSRQPPACFPY